MTQSASSPQTNVHGLIQHAFALRLYKEHLPFEGEDTRERVKERFELSSVATGGAEFRLDTVCAPPIRAGEGEQARHSPVVRQGLTTVERQPISFFEPVAAGALPPLPNAFAWAAQENEPTPWQRFVFAHRDDDDRISFNDFRVHSDAPHAHEDQALLITELLAQLMAQRRSRLFGLDLANRFVNVTLPHALLTQADGRGILGCECSPRCTPKSWLLVPLVSLRRIGHDGASFRRMYSLSLFLIPIDGPQCGPRDMARCEIRDMVEAGWGLASAPQASELSSFEVTGPLCGYVAHLYRPSVVKRLLRATATPEAGGLYPAEGWRLTLRQASEMVMFAIALRMACGSAGAAPGLVERRVGNNVVTSLGNSRVSSVLAMDEQFGANPLDDPFGRVFPGSLESLMHEIATPEARIAPRWRYRLDQPFFDRADYAIGTLPASNCLVAVVDPAKQEGRYESGLMQAGWLAYMAIGAATAIGTIRGIHRELERTNLSEPEAVAGIEREVVVDLSEIYDLDITWDAYRHRYRRLREQLGITSDYQALQGKLEALYRETSARFEAKTQMRVMLLTAAIVLLSVFILIGTIVLAVK